MQTVDAQHEMQGYAQRKIKMKHCISNAEGKSPFNP